MHFRKFIPGTTIIALALCATTALHAAEEKSLWQRFIDWFKPAPTLEGELKELDDKIDRIEGRYSRERRPGNKSRLKKEMESLRAQRDALVQKILDEEAAKKNQPVAAAPASSSAKQVPASSAATAPATVPASSATAAKDVSACKPDTVFVRDTVVIHDTLYVIVAGKPGESAAPAQASTQPADSAAVPQADQTSK